MDTMGRRKFGESLAAAAMAPRIEKQRHYLVVGAGVFGTWTAYQLLSAGHKVVLLDQYGAASSRASSGGESRIIRCAYGPDEIYTRMAKRSLKLWTNFFRESGREFFHRTGVLWMSQPENRYAEQSRETLRKAQVPFRDLSHHDLVRLYPQIQIDSGTIAIFEPKSGALMAREAVQLLLESFIGRGGTYGHVRVHAPRGPGLLDHIVTSDGESIAADAYVFACGPWLGTIFLDLLQQRIFSTRQEVLFFGLPA